MQRLLRLVLPVVLLMKFSCATAQVARDGNVNLLTMYSGEEKSRALQKADVAFLAFCDKNFPSRKEAAAYHAKKGWDFFYASDFTTAIKRYNQA